MCLVVFGVLFFFLRFWPFCPWPSLPHSFIWPGLLYHSLGLRKLCWIFAELFLAIHCGSTLLILIVTCPGNNIDLSLSCFRSWLLPWPLMIFGQSHLKQIALRHLHQSSIWSMAWVHHKSIGLGGLLTRHSQDQTLLILTGDVFCEPPNLESLLAGTESHFWFCSKYYLQWLWILPGFFRERL